MLNKIKSFLSDECGSHMNEYVIVTVITAVGGATALKGVRDAGTAKFEEVALEISDTVG